MMNMRNMSWLATARSAASALSIAALILGTATVASAQTGQQEGQVKAAENAAVADSLYRAARTALNRSDFNRAIELFGKVHGEYPTSSPAAAALYWEAFARYRIGGTNQLQDALARLQEHQTKYPTAATSSDARTLLSRIQGELARLGDPAAAVAVRANAEAAARVSELPPVAVVSPRGTVPPAVLSIPPGIAIVDANRHISALGMELAAARRDIAQAQIDAASAIRGIVMGASHNSGSLPEGCSREEAEIRTAALNGLLMADAERAVPVLRQVLARRDPCSTPLRRTAVLLLAHQVTPETEAVLLETARQDPDIHVRQNAVFHLAQVGTDRAVGVLEEILSTPTDSALHEQALFALAQQRGDERAHRILRSYAARGDAPTRLRGNAIFWVGQDGSPESLAFLQDLYGETEDEQLRSRILFSVAQRDMPETTRWLMRIALDPDEKLQTRTTALHHAGARRDIPVDELASLYDQLAERKLKEQLLYTLMQRDEPAATDKLIEVARVEEDANLRKVAIYWLSQTKDPRAAQVLLEIIGGT